MHPVMSLIRLLGIPKMLQLEIYLINIVHV